MLLTRTRHPPCLRWLLENIVRESCVFTLLEFYRTCHNIDSVLWNQKENEVWKTLGKLAEILPIAALSNRQIFLLKTILRKHGVLPLKYIEISVTDSQQRKLPKMDIQTLTQFISHSYINSLNGKGISQHEAEPFLQSCADACGKLSNRTLVKLVYLLTLHYQNGLQFHQYVCQDMFNTLWKCIVNRLHDLATSDICCIFSYFAVLKATDEKIIRTISATIISRQDELCYDDIMHSLHGINAIHPRLLMKRLFDTLIRKFLEEVNDIEEVSLKDVLFLLATGIKHSVKIPRHFLTALVRYSGRSIYMENIPELVVKLFSGFVENGIKTLHELSPFTKELNIAVNIMSMSSVVDLFELCATLDEPAGDVMLSGLTRALSLAPKASLYQCIRVLTFISKLKGADQHPIIEAIVMRIYTLNSIIAPDKALQLLFPLLRLHCENYTLLVMLAYRVIEGNVADVETAHIIARVCLETNCREKALLDFYRKIISANMNSFNVKELILIYQTVVALELDSPELPSTVLNLLIDHLQKRTKLGRHLPDHLGKAIIGFRDSLVCVHDEHAKRDEKEKSEVAK